MGEYHVSVAGESFANEDGSDRQAEIGRCRVGEAVTFVRDRENRFDANCVRVVSTRGVQIGNVARDAAQWVSERLDNDRPVRAIIDAIGDGGKGMLGVVLAVTTDAVQATDGRTPAHSGVTVKTAPAKTAKKPSAGCLVATIAALGLMVAFCSKGENPQEAKAAAAADAEKHRKGFHCLSSWDGSNRSLVEQVKAKLRDPASFEMVDTKIAPIRPGATQHMVSMTYRARNGFGGMNVGTAIASVDPASCEASNIITE